MSKVPKRLTTICLILSVLKSDLCLNFLSGAHHLDLRASTAEDPDWLVQQRASEIRLIEGWINNYHADKKGIFSM